jgi:hypothetical protein
MWIYWRSGTDAAGFWIDKGMAVPEKNATAASLAASGGAVVVGGLTANELAAWIGIFCAVTTMLVNIFFQWRRDVREERRLRVDISCESRFCTVRKNETDAKF